MQRFFDAIVANDQAALRVLLASDYVAHSPIGPLDRETVVQRIGASAAAFSKRRVIIEGQIAEGDRVITRLIWRGTHTGNYAGLTPTGKAVTVSAVSIERIEDGRIAERWFQQDDLGLMQQLGAIPSQ